MSKVVNAVANDAGVAADASGVVADDTGVVADASSVDLGQSMNLLSVVELLEKHKRWVHKLPGGARAVLKDQSLEGLDLRGVDLRGARLEGCRIVNVDFSHAALEGAELLGCSLINCTFVGTGLDSTSVHTHLPKNGPYAYYYGGFVNWYGVYENLNSMLQKLKTDSEYYTHSKESAEDMIKWLTEIKSKEF